MPYPRGPCSVCGQYTYHFAPITGATNKYRFTVKERYQLRKLRICTECFKWFKHSAGFHEVVRRKFPNIVLPAYLTRNRGALEVNDQTLAELTQLGI